jgi:NAD(P)H dehydrogenase (quinone)
MRDALVEVFRARGDEVAVSDLYAMGFDPVASANDFATRECPDRLVYARERRHAAREGGLAPDIAAEVERVLAADLLASTFPPFWFGPPAILRGWIDRVFVAGLFYGGRCVYGRGGLAGRRAFAAIALGGRAETLGPDAIHGPLATGMLHHFLQGALGYVGLAVHEPFFAHHVPYVGDAEREAMLEDLRRVVSGLDARPIMPVPHLAQFDDRLVRRGGVSS